MRQPSVSSILFVGSDNIREITGNNYEIFKQYSIGKKLRFVRETLEQIHSKKEFSRGKVAKAAGLSYQGLKNIEEEIIKRPYNGTIELLCKIYDLPLKLFTDADYCKMLEGFLIGKHEEKKQFLESYYRLNFHRHALDPNHGVLSSNEGKHDDIDSEAYDVIHNVDGSITFDRYTIEISLKVYQTSTKSLIDENVIVEEAVLAPDDVEHLKGLIKREAEYMKLKFNRSDENPQQDAVRLLKEHIKRMDMSKKDEN